MTIKPSLSSKEMEILRWALRLVVGMTFKL